MPAVCSRLLKFLQQIHNITGKVLTAAGVLSGLPSRYYFTFRAHTYEIILHCVLKRCQRYIAKPSPMNINKGSILLAQQVGKREIVIMVVAVIINCAN